MKQGSAFPEKQRFKSGKEALPVWGFKINTLQRSGTWEPNPEGSCKVRKHRQGGTALN